MDYRSLMARSSIALLATALACGGSDGPNEPDPNAVATLVNAVSVEGGGTAALRTGAAPAASGGPSASVVFTDAVAQGSTGEVLVSATNGFTGILVSSPGREGYYEITLPSARTSVTLLVTYGTTVAGPQTVNYQVVTSGGAVGAAHAAEVDLLNVGTGDVQVNITWNTTADVDLYVVEPGGEEIYYGNDLAASGGQLDLDGNGGCVTDRSSENITWANPPRGTYTVRVNYWDSCDITGSTDWVITVRRAGHAPQTFSGTLSGTGNNGGSGAGTVVTTFTY